MNIDEVISFFGTKSNLARTLGIYRQSITQWINQGYIPYVHQKRIEDLTKKKLKSIKWEDRIK